MPYFSCSAQTAENVEEAFEKVTDLAFERNNHDEIKLPDVKHVDINKELKKEKKCC